MTTIGKITVRADFDERQTGETACNYTVTRVKAGTYPVELEWYGGRAVLKARMEAFLMESYYVNRVFTSSSTDHRTFEDRERPTGYQWRWGDHDRCSPPPTAIFGGKFRLELDEGWIITADYRGNYTGGGPMIFYDVKKEEV